MSAATFNLVIEQNSDYTLSVALNDGAQPTPAPINLTDCTILSEIRRSSLEPVLSTFTTDFVSLTGGLFTLSLSSSQTLGLPITTAADQLRYDVLLTRQDLSKERLFEGSVSVREAITA
jgi:hypothetical protein